MSTLVQEVLFPGTIFNQSIKTRRRLNIAHIRPWIYVEGVLVDGDLKMTILQGTTELITNEINYVDINAAMGDTYNHGFIRFDFESLFLGVDNGNTEEEYIIRLEMVNHTLDANNFLAVNRQWENPLYGRYGGVTPGGEAKNDMIESLGIEIYEWRRA